MNKKIALIGGVSSTLTALKTLHKHGCTAVDVYGFSPKNSELVSGYRDLSQASAESGYKFYPFKRINNLSDKISSRGYDIIMVIGLSQLVDAKIIESAKLTCVGFHPTKLPVGRGRAPIAWLILRETKGAATLFEIRVGDKADAGPIFAQSAFKISRTKDTTASVETKILLHLEKALDIWLPQVKANNFQKVRQNDELSTEYCVRHPEDGFIDWSQPAELISAHIRASMSPHPGAFAFIGQKRLCVQWVDRPIRTNILGVTGKVLKTNKQNYLIQTGCGAIWVDINAELRIGQKLGVSTPSSQYLLEVCLAQLEDKLARIEEGLYNV